MQYFFQIGQNVPCSSVPLSQSSPDSLNYICFWFPPFPKGNNFMLIVVLILWRVRLLHADDLCLWPRWFLLTNPPTTATPEGWGDNKVPVIGIEVKHNYKLCCNILETRCHWELLIFFTVFGQQIILLSNMNNLIQYNDKFKSHWLRSTETNKVYVLK